MHDVLMQLLLVAADKARRDPVRLRRVWRGRGAAPQNRATSFERFRSDVDTWYCLASQRFHLEQVNADQPD